MSKEYAVYISIEGRDDSKIKTSEDDRWSEGEELELEVKDKEIANRKRAYDYVVAEKTKDEKAAYALRTEYNDLYSQCHNQNTEIAELKAAVKARDKILTACYDDIAVGGYIIEQIEALQEDI